MMRASVVSNRQLERSKPAREIDAADGYAEAALADSTGSAYTAYGALAREVPAAQRHAFQRVALN